jgi:hypothetical protein
MKTITLFLLLALSSGLLAQTQTPVAVVAATKMNVLYKGLDNPVAIAVSGVAQENVVVTITGGTIVKQSEQGEYIIRPAADAKEVKVMVAAKIDGKVISVGQSSFRVKNVPNPLPTFAGVREGSISMSQIVTSPFLIVILEDFLFEGIAFRVTNFMFSYVENGNTKMERIMGNKLSDSIVAKIKLLPLKSILYFEDIKCVGPDGAERLLPSLILTIE